GSDVLGQRLEIRVAADRRPGVAQPLDQPTAADVREPLGRARGRQRAIAESIARHIGGCQLLGAVHTAGGVSVGARRGGGRAPRGTYGHTDPAKNPKPLLVPEHRHTSPLHDASSLALPSLPKQLAYQPA